jgi:uncharacterized repeat protein (TIGR03837 family)
MNRAPPSDSAALRWDVFCRVIDNHGDLGVCWRLARQLRDAGQHVRLWVDDASALAWMAPGALQPSPSTAWGSAPHVTVLPWSDATRPEHFGGLEPGDVWIEAFGCELPEAFVAQGVRHRATAPAWINLEYLSAEPWVERHHGLPSPVMSGPALGWTKRFFYPGFTAGTGGLLREADLLAQQQAFDRTAWRAAHAPALQGGGRLISLFCYEPPGLAGLLAQLRGSADHLLVTPGRPLSAMNMAIQTAMQAPTASPATPVAIATPAASTPHTMAWTALPWTDQHGFDRMLWACDLNLVRGEDSLVRALWAGRPFVWNIYRQHDNAHHTKLDAFLGWLDAPPRLRRFHRVWNGIESGALPALDAAALADWQACTQAARQRLLAQDDLLTQLLRWARPSG